MGTFDRNAAVRALLAALAVFLVIGLPTAMLLPHSFFEDWGMVIGPGAWIIGSLTGARAAGLGVRDAVIGSLLAIVPNGVAGALGMHWAGVVAGLAVFAGWCGRAAGSRAART